MIYMVFSAVETATKTTNIPDDGQTKKIICYGIKASNSPTYYSDVMHIGKLSFATVSAQWKSITSLITQRLLKKSVDNDIIENKKSKRIN